MQGTPGVWSENWAGEGSWCPRQQHEQRPTPAPLLPGEEEAQMPPQPWDTPFIPTDFSLMDALEPSSPIPGTFRSRDRGHECEHQAAGAGDREQWGDPQLHTDCTHTHGFPSHLGNSDEEETEDPKALVPQGAATPEGEV
ncbi:hypothetical protein GH733_008135, partial [Mirounga leonina]